MSRGVALPPRGSPKDLVLRELLFRERSERAAEIGMLVRLVGLAAGADMKQVDVILTEYANQLTHTKYNKAYLRDAERKQREEDIRRLRALTDLNSRQ